MKEEMINERSITDSDKLLQSSLEPRATAAPGPTQTPGRHLSHRKQGSGFSAIITGQEDQVQKHGVGQGWRHYGSLQGCIGDTALGESVTLIPW